MYIEKLELLYLLYNTLNLERAELYGLFHIYLYL